jgi:hypothetical protein
VDASCKTRERPADRGAVRERGGEQVRHVRRDLGEVALAMVPRSRRVVRRPRPLGLAYP